MASTLKKLTIFSRLNNTIKAQTLSMVLIMKEHLIEGSPNKAKMRPCRSSLELNNSKTKLLLLGTPSQVTVV
jgi:hypothetical protein